LDEGTILNSYFCSILSTVLVAHQIHIRCIFTCTYPECH
jgi:hypothetical protein